MANDSSSTTLGIQFKSSAIAAVCMCLALKTLSFKSPSLEKWAAKWNDERLRQTDPRWQSVVIVTGDHQGCLRCHDPCAIFADILVLQTFVINCSIFTMKLSARTLFWRNLLWLKLQSNTQHAHHHKDLMLYPWPRFMNRRWREMFPVFPISRSIEAYTVS